MSPPLPMSAQTLAKIRDAVRDVCRQNVDPSHDYAHVKRVALTATRLAELEGANLAVVLPAAYLHDFEFVAKTDSRRRQASTLSAEKAVTFLRELEYPEAFLPQIYHAIQAHSFSAGFAANTLEAKIVQDADRLDAIGAIGIARCFGLSGAIGRDFYHLDDPFCNVRTPDDQTNSLDHFYLKLLKVPEMLHTQSAKAEGLRRLKFMREFLIRLEAEVLV